MEMSPVAARILGTLLEERSGQQLAADRRWRIGTALGPLLRRRNIPSLDNLVAILGSRGDPRLLDEVVEALLNNETFFFRDRAAFSLLTDQALDMLARARAAERSLTIWSAACSTGQEVYSLAMSFAAQPERWAGWRIEILGTDVSRAAIAQARIGRYSQFEIQRGLPVMQMMRCFDQEGDHWRVKPSLRGRVAFTVHNLLDAPPPGRRPDVVLCRNVLLYFATEKRRIALDRIAGAIAPDGVLMLGAGETLLGQTDAFVADEELRGLYRPREGYGGAATKRVA
ncbi:chemotaxis protein CheR [Sphingomonas oleivorans]|uniref:Chemotaxis protein CheR n=1 Tax=Sphingomonas oleivorans TaxID=1735121 RepID=A0A2T5FTI5_9SPHN|nr:protein-glutamate O-methyltransferase CheR [Sphingomonas oleivorans]PTQ07368.1 chemotaxis protein CheR [Sphingomonas oleivorans]